MTKTNSKADSNIKVSQIVTQWNPVSNIIPYIKPHHTVSQLLHDTSSKVSLQSGTAQQNKDSCRHNIVINESVSHLLIFVNNYQLQLHQNLTLRLLVESTREL